MIAVFIISFIAALVCAAVGVTPLFLFFLSAAVTALVFLRIDGVRS